MDIPVLEGEHVRLEPLRAEHLQKLEAIAFDPSNWKYMANPILTKDDLQAWAEQAWQGETEGRMMAWVIVAKFDGRETLAGGTRFLDIDLVNHTIEIGNTWVSEEFRGTKVNTESKYLLLRYAFEQMGMERVAFKTHSANLRSQAAVRAIGAVYEGTFRSHMLMPDGSRRDSAWFSIVKSEWPDVKDLLERRLHTPTVA